MSRSLQAMLRSNRAGALMLVAGALAGMLASPLLGQERLPTWSFEPELRLGSLDGPYAFAALGPVVVSPRTGNVFVNEASQRILAFDSTGRRLPSFGRTGDGPGEFRNLADIYWSDGSVVAFDAGSNRVSWFTEQGELVDSRRIDSARMHASPWAPLEDGIFAGVTRQSIPDGRLIQTRVQLVRMGGKGNDTIMDQFPEVGRHLPVEGGVWVPIPMVAGSYFTADPRGTAVVVVHQYAAQGKDSGGFRVRKIGGDGRLVFSRIYRYTPSPVPDGYVSEFVEGRRGAIQRLGLSTREVERIINGYMPKFLPPISDVRVGADGSIWLRRQTEDADGVWWWVLNQRGDLVARLHLPEGLRIRYVDARTVWGVEMDAMGVNYLVKYRIVRS